MLFKVLSTFLVLQAVSFAFWQGAQAWNANQKSAAPEVKAPVTKQIEYAPLSKVRFSARNHQAEHRQHLNVKEQEINRIINKLPAHHTKTLKNVVLDYDPKAHRGLGGKSLIIMRAVDMNIEEFMGVLIHEIGHTVDLGSMSERSQRSKSEFMDGNKPVYRTDPSLLFYRISWVDDKTKKKTAHNQDFVSGYAMSDPFEDFAESYVYYILHNKEFLSLTKTSEALRKKYDFIKDTVFDGKVFDTGNEKDVNLWNRPWDITVLDYDLVKFLSA